MRIRFTALLQKGNAQNWTASGILDARAFCLTSKSANPQSKMQLQTHSVRKCPGLRSVVVQISRSSRLKHHSSHEHQVPMKVPLAASRKRSGVNRDDRFVGNAGESFLCLGLLSYPTRPPTPPQIPKPPNIGVNKVLYLEVHGQL